MTEEEKQIAAILRIVEERDEARKNIVTIAEIRDDAVKRLEIVRALLNSPYGDEEPALNVHEAAERVVKERNALWLEVTRLKCPPGWGQEISSIREYLGTPPGADTLGMVKSVIAVKNKEIKDLEEDGRQTKQKLIDAHERVALVQRMLEGHERHHATLRSILGHPQVSLEEAARKVVQELQETRSVLGAKNDEAADAVALRMIKLGLDYKSERDAARARVLAGPFSLINAALGASKDESSIDACKRIVAERDALQKHNEHLLTSVAHEQNLASKVLKELEEANLARAELSASLEKAVAGRDELQKGLEEANLALSGAARERDAWRGLFEQIGRTLDRTAYENITDAAKRVAAERRYAIESLEKTLKERDALQQNLDAATKMLNDMNDAVQSVVKERDALFPSNDPNNPRLELEGFRKGDLVRTPSQREYVPVERVGPGHAGYWYVYVNGGGWEPQTLVRKPVEKGDKARCVKGPYEGEHVDVVLVDKNYVEVVRKGATKVHVIDRCQVVAVAS